MGRFSTPLLHKVSVDSNRILISVDNDLNWINQLLEYNGTELHRLIHLKSKDNMHTFGLDRSWAMVLVDHKYGEERYMDVINFAKQARLVVLHDAEKMAEQGYQYEKNRVRDSYKFACKFSIFRDPSKSIYASTLILSNFIDLKIFEVIFDKVKTPFGHVSCDLSF